MNLELVTDNFKKYDHDSRDILNMVNRFIKFHKKLEDGYDKDNKMRNGTLSLINDIIDNKRNPMNFVLCMVYDVDVKKFVGFSIAQKSNLTGTEWHIPATYLDEEYRGKKIGDVKISVAMSDYIENKVRQKGGKEINSYILTNNIGSLISRQRNGFFISKLKEQSGASINKVILNINQLEELAKRYKNKTYVLVKNL